MDDERYIPTRLTFKQFYKKQYIMLTEYMFAFVAKYNSSWINK